MKHRARVIRRGDRLLVTLVYIGRPGKSTTQLCCLSPVRSTLGGRLTAAGHLSIQDAKQTTTVERRRFTLTRREISGGPQLVHDAANRHRVESDRRTLLAILTRTRLVLQRLVWMLARVCSGLF